MSSVPRSRITTEAYLAFEQESAFKNEYLEGELWAMSGASDAHVTIALNLASLIKQQLKDSPCRVYISDMKVNVETANAFFYPDVFISCEPRSQKNSLFKQHPVFIAEVLSPSTEAFDRGKKFAYYRQLASLQNYWLIDSLSMSIDCFLRADSNDWLLHTVSQPEQLLVLDNPSASFPVQAIYEDVVFE